MNDVEYIRKFSDECCAEVSRKGESQPCGKVAVAVTSGDDDWDGPHWWPVCKHHARGRAMVSLTDLITHLDNARQS